MTYSVKNIFLSALLLIMPVISKGQKVNLAPGAIDTTGLALAISQVLQGLQQQDFEKINALIHPQMGLYLQFTIGSSFSFSRVEHLEKNDNIHFSNMFASYQFADVIDCTYEPLPALICEEHTWAKTGNFYYPQFQYLRAQYQLLLQYQMISPEELKGIESELATIDQNYVGVFLLNPKEENDLLLYFKRHDDHWYLTVWDMRYFCDA